MMTNLSNEFDPIRQWAKERGILSKGDYKSQYLKFQEEAGELSKALLHQDIEQVTDALGDVVVTLVNLAALCELNLEDCINTACNAIAPRTGEMKNGTFVRRPESPELENF